MSILVIKWAKVSFLYEKLLREGNDVDIIHVKHHSSWTNGKKRTVVNLFFLVKQFFRAIRKSSEYDNVIIFGTNLSRIIPFFIPKKKLKIAVYNEIGDGNKLLSIIDKFNFMLHENKICFSTLDRLKLYQNCYNRNFLGVIPNLPDINYFEDIETINKFDEIIYCGIINKNRFGDETIEKIKESKYFFNFLGPTVDIDYSQFNNVTYHGEKSHQETVELQSKYRFALLSYPQSDLNNDYCAPIKIYEYINGGCVCVSVNSNKGLYTWLNKYPNLFVLLEDVNDYIFDEKKYMEQRESFILEEIELLKKEMIISE